jgi:hypothetical protein
MSVLSPILRLAQDNTLLFWCPGCNECHGVKVGDGPGPRWAWNTDPTKPTFTPSILVRSGHYMPDHKGECWCDYNKLYPEDLGGYKCSVCHSFIQEGSIIFLDDCTHTLRGQTVPLPEWTN